MHTPDQAKQLWCPMARGVQTDANRSAPLGAPVANRIFDTARTILPASCMCIAEQCAMWRWVPSNEVSREPAVINHGNGNYSKGYKDVPVPPTQGYCGVAGRPEVE